MIADALIYLKEYNELSAKNKREKSYSSSGEFLSGLTKTDRLHPVIGLCIYYGEEKRDGPTNLVHMIQVTDDLKPMISDYKMNLLQIRSSEHFQFQNNDVQTVFDMVRLIYEEDYTNFNKRYKDKSIPAELGLTIGSIVNSQRIINQSLTMEEKEREIDMCKALENLVNNSKLEEKKETVLRLSDMGMPIEQIAQAVKIAVEDVQNWIQESDNIVFISGADLSAEAGFPDYRIMTQADWARYKYAPDEILRLTFLQRNPFYFYRYYREKILAPVLTAQPSPAHEALAHLEQAGKLRAILTVNIDGIHQEAGSREVLELHGSVMRSWCAKCEKFLDFFYIADSPTHIPYCNVDMCGDYVRPAIVLKEEPYDLALLEKALDYVRAADVLIIDGSALKEFPVPNLMQAYQRHKLVLVNTAPLVFDARAGIVIRNHSFTDIFQQIHWTR